MKAEAGLALAALAGGAVPAGILLLIGGLRGVDVAPGRPASRTQRTWHTLRAPATRLRIAVAVGAAALTIALTSWPVAGLAAAGLVIVWPQMFGGPAAERLAIARLEALVVWTESLRDTITAGIGLEEAIPASTHQAPALIRPALVRLNGQIRARTPLDQALLDLAVELADPGADQVIAALILNVRRRGDRLGSVLTGLAATAREELDMRRRITAGRAGIRRAVQIVVVVTVVIAAYLIVFEGSFLAPYDSPGGQVALAVVLGVFAAGFAWMRRLSEVPESKPFLSRADTGLTGRDVLLIAAVTGLSGDDAADLAYAPPSAPAGGTR